MTLHPQPPRMTPEPGLASDPHGRLSVALAVCAQRLAADPVGAVEEREVLAEVLVTLRESAGALRAVLYENITLPTVGPAARLLVEVWAPSERSLTEIYGLERTLIWSKMTDADRMAMAAGEPIGGSIAQRFADAPLMCADLDELGIGTLHMFPIMFSGQWWGHLGLSHREPQSWRDSEVQLMRAAAAMIGMFLQRNREVAALRAREAMLEGLSDSLPDAFLYQIEEQPDGTSRRTYLSRSLEQRSGISVDLALHDFDLLPTRMHPDDVSAYEAAKQYAQKNNTPYKFEHRYTTTDGSIRWMRWHSSPRVTSDGRRLWSGLATDITDYQQLQESLRQANQNLRRRIDQLVLFNQIAQHLGGMTNTSTTLSVVCRLICAMFNASEVLVALRDLPARDLKMVARAAAMDVDDLLSPTMLARIEASLGADNGVTWVEGPTPPGYVVLAVALAAQDMPIGLLLICVAQADAHLSGEIISLAQTVAGAIAGAAVGAQLYVRAVQSRERLERLNAASRMINESGLDPQALYGAIHCAVAHLMPVEAFVITLVEAGSAVAETVYAYDLAGLEQGTYRFGLEQSFVGYMRQHGSTLRVDDFRQFYQQHPEVKFHVYGDEQDTRSAVAASLRTSDGVYGILFSQCYLPGVYSDEDLTILELLSVHAATAIQNVRRAQQRRRDAIDEERSRLARDLHDSVNQSLFSASLIAERLPEMMQLSPDDANEGLRQLHQLTRSALAEMRALLIELRPAALAAAPLHQAINHLAQAFGGRRGITIKTELDPAPVLPPEVQIALYRIVQESLSNVIKHAYARTAHVRMEVTPLVGDSEVSWSGTIDIQVRDNGRGFAIDQVGVGRFGLEIMRERATAIGAELELLSQTGVGTQVTLIWCGSAGVA